MFRRVFNALTGVDTEKYLKMPRLNPPDKGTEIYFSHEFAERDRPWLRSYFFIEQEYSHFRLSTHMVDNSEEAKKTGIVSAQFDNLSEVIKKILEFEKECTTKGMIKINHSSATYQNLAAKNGLAIKPNGEIVEIAKGKPVTEEITFAQRDQKDLFKKDLSEIKEWKDLYRLFDAEFAKMTADEPDYLRQFAGNYNIYRLEEVIKKTTNHLPGGSNYDPRENFNNILFYGKLPECAKYIIQCSILVGQVRRAGQAFKDYIKNNMQDKDLRALNEAKQDVILQAQKMSFSAKQVDQITDLIVRGQDPLAPKFPIDLLMSQVMDMRKVMEEEWRIAEEKRLAEFRAAAEAFMEPVEVQPLLPAPPERKDLPPSYSEQAQKNPTTSFGPGPTSPISAQIFVKGIMTAEINMSDGRKYRLTGTDENVNASLVITEDKSVRVVGDILNDGGRHSYPPKNMDTKNLDIRVDSAGKVEFIGEPLAVSDHAKPEPKKSGLHKLFGL